jgi:hypothetical protein
MTSDTSASETEGVLDDGSEINGLSSRRVSLGFQILHRELFRELLRFTNHRGRVRI